MEHPDTTTMLRYISDDVSSDEQLSVDTHLAVCPTCLSRVRAWSYLEENLDSLWDSWTAATHGSVYRRWRLVKALRDIVEATPALAEQVWQWVERLREGFEFSVRVLIDRSRAIASLGTCALPPQCEFKLCLSDAGIGSPDEQTDLENHLHHSSELLSDNRPNEAANELLQAMQIDARSSQAAVSQISRHGQLLCQTVVDSRRGRILVKFWPQEGQPWPSLALLVPEDEEGRVLAATFNAVENETYVLAEFDQVDRVSYALQIEPPAT